MARLKSEVLQLRYDKKGIPARSRFIRNSAQLARRFSGPLAPLVNAVQKTELFKRTIQSGLGFSPERNLPGYAKQTLTSWYQKEYHPKEGNEKVVLFADTYCNHHESSTGIAAVRLLDNMGYHVLLADKGCCQRPRISNGFLKDAKKDGLETLLGLKPYFDSGIPVLTLEPSCGTSLTVDLPDLIEDEPYGQKAKMHVKPLELFVAKNIDRLELSSIHKPSPEILLHGHCHQKAIFGTQAIHQIFSHLGIQINEPDSGCCGMAGAFGYEKEHFHISNKIGERVLFKAIEQTSTETPIAASGFSCRHQIKDFTGRKALHWVELIEVKE